MKRITFVQARSKPHLDFVLPGLLLGSVGLIVGQGAVGKTYLALHIGIGIPLGRPIAEANGEALWPAQSSGKVAVILGEDPPEIVQDRLHSLRAGLQLDERDEEILDHDLEVISFTDEDDDMRLALKNGSRLERGPFYETLRGFCEGRRLVIIDPLALVALGLEEKDNGDMAQAMRMLAGIARATGCAILVLHHVGKTRDGGEDWERARGASSLTTSVRLQVNLGQLAEAECKDMGIPIDDRGMWVRVAQTKANYGAPAAPRLLRRAAGGVLRAMPTPMLAGAAEAQQKKQGGRNGAI
uniref:Putative nucleoside triphosphate hydrolase n=1 Tax=mine drainage metagenome TaxID=410659 RepID=E6PSI5_9ZZZZ